MDSGSYVTDNSSLLAPPPRFPFSLTTSRHSLPNLDPNDIVVSFFSLTQKGILSNLKIFTGSPNHDQIAIIAFFVIYPAYFEFKKE